MFTYLIHRVLASIPVALIVAIIAFGLIRLASGDPALAFLPPAATDQQVAEIHRQLGLDRPITVQFFIWLKGLLRGDLGHSFFLGRDVATAIIERIPATLQLTLFSLLFAVMTGLPAGVIAAARHNTAIDRFIMTLTLVGVSIPVFWLGLLLMWFFAVQLRWFPSGGYVSIFENFWQGVKYTTLPAIALGTLHSTLIARITRASVLETIKHDYVRTARSKGLAESAVLYGHVLRNAMIPTITVIGITFSALLSGTVIIETVFTYPGVGRLVVGAVRQRDYGVVQGTLLIVAGIYLFVNLLVDLTYGLFDPRIRYE